MTSFVLFLLLACGGGETPAPAGDGAAPAPAPHGEAPAPAPAAGGAFAAPESLEAGMDICLGGADCAAVQLSCCCGEGAVWVAANKSRAEDVKAKYGQKDCGDCPAGECTPPEVQCQGGCKLK